MLSTAHSAEEAEQPTPSSTSVRPTDINHQPIIWHGNPAHLEGILYELGKYVTRNGTFVPLFTHCAVLLPNGKMATDSIQASNFCPARPSLPPSTTSTTRAHRLSSASPSSTRSRSARARPLQTSYASRSYLTKPTSSSALGSSKTPTASSSASSS